MNSPQIEAAIKKLEERLARLENVEAAILFGSAARGTATEDSDVDVMIVTPRENEEAVLEVIWAIEGDLPVRISPLFADGDFEDFDPHLLESLFRDGRVLVGEFPPLTVEDLGLEPMRLVKYRMEGLTPVKRGSTVSSMGTRPSGSEARRSTFTRGRGSWRRWAVGGSAVEP